MNKVCKLLFLFSLLIIIVGCSSSNTKKIIDTDTFIKKMEERGYEVENMPLYSQQHKEYIGAYRADKEIKQGYSTSVIKVFYYEFDSNKNAIEFEYKMFCNLGKEKNLKHKDNVMCQWDKTKGLDYGFLFVADNTVLMIEYTNKNHYDTVIELINDLGYSSYLDD